MIGDGVRVQASAFLALRGQVIHSWRGVETAVRGADEGEPEFDGPDVPCLQLLALEAATASGAAVTVTTYQDDSRWGRCAQAAAGREGGDLSRGYRRRVLAELPTGRVREVSVHRDGDTLAEVGLRFGERDLLLVAGEAHENHWGRLVWHRLDEYVLAFTDPGEAARMRWVPDRKLLHRMS